MWLADSYNGPRFLAFPPDILWPESSGPWLPACSLETCGSLGCHICHPLTHCCPKYASTGSWLNLSDRRNSRGWRREGGGGPGGPDPPPPPRAFFAIFSAVHFLNAFSSLLTLDPPPPPFFLDLPLNSSLFWCKRYGPISMKVNTIDLHGQKCFVVHNAPALYLPFLIPLLSHDSASSLLYLPCMLKLPLLFSADSFHSFKYFKKFIFQPLCAQ